jgi:hypothetical protein
MPVGDQVGHPVAERGAEQRDADRAAHGPEGRDQRGRGADIAVAARSSARRARGSAGSRRDRGRDAIQVPTTHSERVRRWCRAAARHRRHDGAMPTRYVLPQAGAADPAAGGDAATSRPRTSGSDIRPASVGLIPWESWKYCARKTVEPNIATPTVTLATTAREMVRLRKRWSGIIGSATRDSTYTASDEGEDSAADHQGGRVEAQAKLVPASETQASRRDAAHDQGRAEVVDGPFRGRRGRCSVAAVRRRRARERQRRR